MLIAVEATRLEQEVRGIGRYVRAMLPRLVEQDSGLRLTLFAASGGVTSLAESIARDTMLRDRVSVRPVREMTRSQADVYWFPWNVVSPVPLRGPSVVTVHDVAPVALPDPRWLAWRKNLRWRLRYRRSARVATLMIADSVFTASEIQRVLGVGAARIRVAPLAADDFGRHPAAGDSGTLARLGVRAPFVLSVGAADRRKNLALLENAMRTVVAAHPGATLVLAGPRRGGRTQEEHPWSRTLGFVSEPDLAALYRNALVFVSPSTYEGFGLPVLEAMQVGTPVICAHAASLPEVAGDAALWVTPGNEQELAAAISRVLESPTLRVELSVRAARRSRLFSWDETARLTLAAFGEARELYALAGRPTPPARLEAAHSVP